MSNGGGSRRRPKISTGTTSVRLIAVSLASAAAIFGGLAVQMAHGHDPALGAGTSQAQSTQQDQSTQQQSTPQDQSGGVSSGVVTRAS